MVQLPPSGSATAASTHTKKVNHGVHSGQGAGWGGGAWALQLNIYSCEDPCWAEEAAVTRRRVISHCKSFELQKKTPNIKLSCNVLRLNIFLFRCFTQHSQRVSLHLSAGGLERADSESRPLQSDHQDAGAEVHPLPRCGCVQIIFTRVTRV